MAVRSLSTTDRRRGVEQLLAVDGGTVRLVTTGPAWGTPLLMINGLGARLENWATFCDGLAERRVIMFDLPDDSAPSGRRMPSRMRGLAIWVTHLLDELGEESTDVLGYSWGGALAQQLTLDAPHRVRRLVLAATNYGIGSWPVAVGPTLRLLARRRGVGDELRQLIGAILGTGLPSGSGDGTVISGAPMGSYLRQLYAFTGWSSLAQLWSIRRPTLVIAGDQDPLIPICTTRVLAGLIPDARLEVMRGAGHLFLLDRPAQSSAVIDDFLGCDDRGRGADELRPHRLA